VTALTRAGVTSVEDLAVLSVRDLSAIPGLGPGMIAAIRLVVPEPRTSVDRSGAAGAQPETVAVPAIDPEPVPDEEESPAAPVIPSFESLRAPRRREGVDVLLPPVRTTTTTTTTATSAGAPRPAEYADLVRLGVRVVSAVAGAAGRVALWSVREPARCLRALLGA
jgi:hypothetical protein